MRDGDRVGGSHAADSIECESGKWRAMRAAIGARCGAEGGAETADRLDLQRGIATMKSRANAGKLVGPDEQEASRTKTPDGWPPIRRKKQNV